MAIPVERTGAAGFDQLTGVGVPRPRPASSRDRVADRLCDHLAVRVLSSAGDGPDPVLLRSFPADRSDTVATATVGGRPVVVTTKYFEEFCDCERSGHPPCPEPGLRVWDRQTGERLCLIPDLDGFHLVTLEIAGRPYAVVQALRRDAVLVDLEAGAISGVLPGHEGTDNTLDVAQARTLDTVETAAGTAVITGGWGALLRVAVPQTGSCLVIDTGDTMVSSLAGLRIGDRPAVIAWSGANVVWDATDGSRIRTLPGDRPATSYGTWPDDSGLVAIMDLDRAVTLWDARTGERLPCAMPTPNGRAHTLTGVLTAGGRRVLTLSDDTSVHLWDAGADRRYRPPLTGPTGFNLVAGAEPGVLAVVSGEDDAVSVWRLPR